MADKLRKQVGVILRRGKADGVPAALADPAVDDVARRGIEDLVRQVERLEVRLNLILAVILGTLVVDAVKAFVH